MIKPPEYVRGYHFGIVPESDWFVVSRSNARLPTEQKCPARSQVSTFLEVSP
jgi:hypothetical protein